MLLLDRWIILACQCFYFLFKETCKTKPTFATSVAKDTLKIWSSLILSFSKTSWRLPLVQYTDKMHTFIGSVHAPTSWLIFLWLRLRICKREKQVIKLNKSKHWKYLHETKFQFAAGGFENTVTVPSQISIF